MVRSIAQSLAAVATLLMAGPLAGCNSAADSIKSMESAPGVAADAPCLTSAGDAAKALAQLEYIPVKGRATKTGYTRNEFGPIWAYVDHNGCDTRNDILARDLVGEMFKAGTNNCVVAAGVLADKYTGTTIRFAALFLYQRVPGSTLLQHDRFCE
ncbi:MULTISPECIES: hypothetical protein [unclassified Arthrobacter]|uniref:hypothetical protein n=1 Tax=unclassified Arthrobacter TaxID=235627 RepID=UPI001EF14D4C|nr:MULTISPECIES: hypothetical protein [unclassified Arthrobacter]UKA72874.1 hypothetical protein LFT49_09220 [Arthrobacter sp. FW306-06-A]UKA77106.1 hypothetical protein LFT46_08785 [Arthrobacter sp. FW306-07-I]